MCTEGKGAPDKDLAHETKEDEMDNTANDDNNAGGGASPTLLHSLVIRDDNLVGGCKSIRGQKGHKKRRWYVV